MSSYPGGDSQVYKPYEDPALLEQQRLAQQLGPCPKGLPRLFGYSKKKTVCKKCNTTFKNVYFPEAGSMDRPHND
ncbi:525_t:CDS:2 [Scutellospora calospora]|uniref:525_t:CDS:1 n=1 Tax=Scutellospora calospora TaxID=85575 RepID=A0ACA9L541_9GLOM|nr:525_t:CDS:2 [Scutellospora calospora]